MKQKTVYLMAGIPASGKSTFIQKEMDVYEKAGQNCIWCSRDNVRFSMVGENEEYFSKENQVFRAWINSIKTALNDDAHDVIYIDATHVDKVSRAKTLRNLNINKDYHTLICVCFNTDVKTCIERNSNREGRARVPDKAIYSMYHRFVKPALEEGFDSIEYV